MRGGPRSPVGNSEAIYRPATLARGVSAAVRALAVLLLLASLTLGPLAGPASAKEPRAMTWDYTVRVDDPASGLAHITMTFGNLKDLVTKMSFRTAPSDNHPYRITNVTGEVGTSVSPTADGVTFKVDDALEAFSFDVAVAKAAVKPGQFNSVLNADFGLFRADAFALPYNYSYFEGTPFTWTTRVRLLPPSGWNAEAPWPKESATLYRTPANETLPRGFIAMAPAASWVERSAQAAGMEHRYVRIGPALAHDADVLPYLANATPYYRSVYGDVAGPVLLAVSAPAPMYEGGLGGPYSLYVRDSTDLRTLAHEYAHVFQTFATIDVPGASTLWVNEGDADYHSALSLFATDRWSLSQVNDLLRKGYDVRLKPEGTHALVSATYGAGEDSLAYTKGAVVLHALDLSMRKETDGKRGLADLLAKLNRDFDSGSSNLPGGPREVSNDDVLKALGEITARDYGAFFGDFIYGTKWPALEPVVVKEEVALDNLTLAPPRATTGAKVNVTLEATNRGLDAVTKTYDVALDGAKVGSLTLALPVGATRRATLAVTAPAPGDHVVKVSYLDAKLRVLTPAALTALRITTVPLTPAAATPAQVLVYVANAGDLSGDADVALTLDGLPFGEPRSIEVAGNVSEAVAFDVVFPDEGALKLGADVTPRRGAASATTLDLTVAPRDGDGDGVPDKLDAYPDNPALTEPGALNDARNALPTPALAWLVAALAAAAVVVGRRPR